MCEVTAIIGVAESSEEHQRLTCYCKSLKGLKGPKGIATLNTTHYTLSVPRVSSGELTVRTLGKGHSIASLHTAVHSLSTGVFVVRGLEVGQSAP